MRTVLLLVRRGLRTARGLVVATLLLTTLASALLTLGHQAMVDFPKAVDEQFARLASEDIQFNSLNPKVAEALRASAAQQSGVTQMDVEQAMMQYGSFRYGGSDQASQVAFLDESSQPKLGRSRIIERGPAVEQPAYLPAIFKQGGGYRIGDEFVLKVSGRPDQVFHVAGFFENTFMGTITMEGTALLLPHEEYLARSRGAGAIPQGPITRVRVADADQIDRIQNEVIDRALAKPDELGRPVAYQAPTASLMRPAYTLDASLYSVLLMGFCVVITLVAMTVIAFLVRSSVVRDMVAIGVQKAVGLSTGQVLLATFAPVVVSALAGVALGTGCAQLALPKLAAVQNGQSGLDWQPGFLFSSLLVCLAVVVGGCLLSSVLASLGVRRIVPVTALRGGTPGHSFGSSILPLDRSRGRLPLLLGAKQAWASVGQSIAIILVTAVVTFTGVFATVLGKDALGNPETLRFMAVGELEDISIGVNDLDHREQLRAEVAARPEVRAAFFSDWMPLQVEGSNAAASVLDDYSVHEHSAVHEGREPRHANEVAIGDKVARSAGKSIGDQVTLTDHGRSEQFLVVGLLSTVQHFGMRVDLTTDGYRRLAPGYSSERIVVHLREADSAVAARVSDDLRRHYGSRAQFVADVRGVTDGVLANYINVVQTLGRGMQLLGWALVALVISLLVRSMLVGQRRQMGVRKALGATTTDLVAQVVSTHLPTLVIGALLGAVVGWFASLPLVEAIVSVAGISHLDIGMRPVPVLVIAAVTVAIALVFVLFESLRLRKVSAYELFRE